MDTERYRYQKFISDLSGQDIRAHGNDVERAIDQVRTWLIHYRRGERVPSSKNIVSRFRQFQAERPGLAEALEWDPINLTYVEKKKLMATYLALDATTA